MAKKERSRPVFDPSQIAVVATKLSSGYRPEDIKSYPRPPSRHFRCEAAHIWDHDPNTLRKYRRQE